MSIKIKAGIFYVAVLIILTGTTLFALYDGGYHTEGGAIAGLALASIITSLLPFFVSMHLLNKYGMSSDKKPSFKVWGLIIYTFCFPLKLWIIFSNIDMLINGGNGWSFG